ncbi:MAG: DUF1343 domain-containing protein [bacterium]|nr:DUF1343 domain-containing protein [bacterium]
MLRSIQTGLERLCSSPTEFPIGERCGLLMNQASVDAELNYACDLISACFPNRLSAIFSPQHGLWGEQQANMIESPHDRYARLDLPVFSLYSETRRPKPEMLANLDCFLIDLQDVGTRVYTFCWTVMHCLEACAEHDIPVIVLDRPNPLGGEVIEGPILEADYQSFVGRACVPMRHGLTMGELAVLVNREFSIGANLNVISMQGWDRSLLWCDLDRPWLAPSPNLPRFESVLLYPGQVLLEGTNLSEGRGTTLPFEFLGAPFLSSQTLLQVNQQLAPESVKLMPTRFLPTFDKWQHERCEGVALRVLNPTKVRSFETTVRLLMAIAEGWPDDFQLLPPPYEYETEKMPIDILYGKSDLRRALLQRDHSSLSALCDTTPNAWWQRVKDYLLY